MLLARRSGGARSSRPRGVPGGRSRGDVPAARQARRTGRRRIGAAGRGRPRHAHGGRPGGRGRSCWPFPRTFLAAGGTPPRTRCRSAPGTPEAGLMERLHRILGDAERPMMLLGGGGWSEQARARTSSPSPTATGCRSAPASVATICSRTTIRTGSANSASAPTRRWSRASAPPIVLLVVGARLGEATSQGYTLFDADEPTGARSRPSRSGEIGRVFPAALAIAAESARFAAAASRARTLQGRAAGGTWTEAARHDYERDRRADPMAARARSAAR